MPQTAVTAVSMMTRQEKSQRRQLAYQNRSRSARLYGKLLIPVALITFSTSLWSDPVLGPQLEAGLEDAKPLLASYAQNTPLDGMFGPVPDTVEAVQPSAAQIEDGLESTEEASLTLDSSLPKSAVPVNRP